MRELNSERSRSIPHDVARINSEGRTVICEIKDGDEMANIVMSALVDCVFGLENLKYITLSEISQLFGRDFRLI